MLISQEYKIRKMLKSDEDYWKKMWLQYLNFYETTMSPQIIEHTFNKLLANDTAIGCLLACDKQDQPVAFLTYISHLSTWKIKPVCYLNDLFVCENHRNQGIAALLLNDLKRLAEQFEWSQIYWLTKPDNHIARTFYEKIAQGQPWIEYVIN